MTLLTKDYPTSAGPKFYGLPKIHKHSIPLGPLFPEGEYIVIVPYAAAINFIADYFNILYSIYS